MHRNERLRQHRVARNWRQHDVADQLGISVTTIQRWERGDQHPSAYYRIKLCALFGKSVQELGLVEVPPQQSSTAPILALRADGPRVDWGDALGGSSFYGREREVAQLSHWVVEEHCRLVSVLGQGGMGKSALTVSVMHQVAEHFEVVIWRSLRDAPTCEALLDECLQVLAPQSLHDVSVSLERRLSLLLDCVRRTRVLLVLDNLETLLEENTGTGHMRPGYEGYTHVLRQMAEAEHQSCLLLTSREKPGDLVPLEGSRTGVRALHLGQLESDACEHVLVEKDIVGSAAERTRLSEVYAGNPLALKIVAQTIVELFAGSITPFLEQGEVVFGGVRDLLSEQYDRLSDLEQTVLCWLAIVREPVTMGEVRTLLVAPRLSGELLEALDALLRRSLVERGQHPGTFTLQSVVLEYVTMRFIAETSRELEQGHLSRLLQHGLSQAGAKDYIQQTQQRLLVRPLLVHMQSVHEGHAPVEGHLCSLLDQLRSWSEHAQGYGPTNLTTLLLLLRGNLRGLDLSHLSVRDLSLQGVEMQDASLAGATLQGCIFTQAFDGISAVTMSRSSQYWAAVSRQGEAWIWDEGGQTLHRMWRAHMDRIRALEFSPDGRSLVTGSWDNTFKLWDVASGALLWSDWHASNLASVAFAPNGRVLATGGGTDATVHLWDVHSGTRIQTLSHPSPVSALAWSPDGRLLASGHNGSIQLWEGPGTQQATTVQTLSGHTSWVMGLAFSPDGTLLASGSWDGTVKVWEVSSRRLRQELTGHTDRVNRVVWSDDGQTLASCSRDKTIRLWESAKGDARALLLGHTADIFGLTFTADTRSLLSGSDDGTLRVWDAASGQCTRVMHGYVASLFGIDWSPDGTQLVSGGTDTLVTVWDASSGKPFKVLRGHRWSISGVGWSPDGSVVASSGWDGAIRLWDVASGTWTQIPEHPDDPDTIFFSVAWSPSGHHLASGTYDSGVLVWDVTAHTGHWVGRELPTGIRHVAWSPDGTRLVDTGDESTVYVWDALDGTLLQQLPGQQGIATCVAWSPDGTRLVSGGRSRERGSLFVWDVQRGECVFANGEQGGVVTAVAWGSSEDVLISGESEGRLCWWDIPSGACVRVRAAHQGTVHSLKVSPDGHQLASCGDDGAIKLWDVKSGEHLQTLRRDRPYERLNITGIRGVTEAQKMTLYALGAFEETSNGE